MKTKLALALATAALVASAGASAQTTSVFDLTTGTFANPYTFSAASPFSLLGDTNSSGVTWFGVLLQAPSLAYTSLDTNPDDGFSFGGLAAGTYSLTFLGSGTGGYGGYYSIAAVPEPATYAMMFGGLSLLGLMASRRRR